MKNIPAIAITFALAAFTACEKKPEASPAVASTEAAKTFDATTEYLDAGGDFYLYVRTEQILKKVPGFMDRWKDAIVEMVGDESPTPPEEIDAWYSAVRKAFLDTGVTQLRAAGVSIVDVEPGLSRTKSVMFTGGMQDPGLFWKIFGSQKSHALPALDFLPASTVYTGFSDFNPSALYDYLMQVVDSIPNTALKVQAQQYPAFAEMMLGMPATEFFASMGTEAGFVVTASETETMTVPGSNGPLELPKASIAILFRTADDKFYNLLVQKIDETVGKMLKPQKSDTDGLRTVTVPVPNTGLPVAPTIARFGDYTVIATSLEIVKELARVGDNAPALLKDTEAFKKFSGMEKMEGTGFAYLSERGGDILKKIQLQSIGDDPDMTPAVRTNIEKLYSSFSQRFLFQINRQDENAVTSVMYSSNGADKIIASLAVVPVMVVGVVAAVVIPAQITELVPPDIEATPTEEPEDLNDASEPADDDVEETPEVTDKYEDSANQNFFLPIRPVSDVAAGRDDTSDKRNAVSQ